jgi:hypothetical protein
VNQSSDSCKLVDSHGNPDQTNSQRIGGAILHRSNQIFPV